MKRTPKPQPGHQLPQVQPQPDQNQQVETSTLIEYEEFKILAINTPFLWRKGVEEEDGSKFKSGTYAGKDIRTVRTKSSRIRFDKDGISLMPYYMFSRTKSYPISTASPLASSSRPMFDFALDDCDIMYVLDCTTKKILIYDLNSGLIDSIEDIRLSDPKAIRVGENELYILNSNDVLVISKSNLQQLAAFNGIGTNPSRFDLDSNENIFVLDPSEKQIYKVIILSGQISVFFKETSQVRIEEPIDLSVGKHDDQIYVLDTKLKIIHIIGSDGVWDRSFNIENLYDFLPSSLAVYDADNIFVSNSSDKGLPFPRKYSLITGKTELLGYNRPSHKILVNRNGNSAYVINIREGWMVRMDRVKRVVSSGGYISKKLDSGIPQVQWHKFVIEYDLARSANNSIEVSYYVSDNDTAPPPLPPPLQAAQSSNSVSSLPSLTSSASSSADRWITIPAKNPTDCLMQNARGRYLWFGIRLFSQDNLKSPKVYSLKAYLPRLSYLRYLPAIYQENESSVEFLQRFLSLFETLFTGIDEEIFSFTKFIDSEATPDDFLPWLASWLGLTVDENWSKRATRELIRRAPELYRKRGTRKGIEEIILIYLDNVLHTEP